MKAIFFEKHGDIDVLKYADLPDPEPAPGEVLVKVKAVALNHLDIWVRKGWKGLRLDLPHITGSDVAGEVVSVNAPSDSSSPWTPGTRVVINPGILTGRDEWTRSGRESLSPGYKVLGEQISGGMAEYVCVPIENVFRLPDEISFEHGAAPLLVATTAWRMLFHCGDLRAGQHVLVVGSGGGVNSISVQLAKKAGAKVTVLAGSKEKAKKVADLGADEVILYKDRPDWHVEVLKQTKGRGVDIVVDNVGASTIPKSLRAVARGGKIVTVGNTSGPDLKFDNRLMFTKQISFIGSTMGSTQDFMDAVSFLWRENIHPVIDCTAPLKEGIEQMHRLEQGEQFGKIVLVP